MVKKKDIAAALGISPSAVTKHLKRGMPATSVAAARAWCQANLDPVRRVAQQLGGMGHTKGKARPSSTSELVAAANEIGRMAVADFDRHERALRQAMGAVPASARPLVLLEEAVWHRLIYLDRYRGWQRVLGTEAGEPKHADQSEEDKQWVDDWLWQLATGAVVIGPLPGSHA